MLGGVLCLHGYSSGGVDSCDVVMCNVKLVEFSKPLIKFVSVSITAEEVQCVSTWIFFRWCLSCPFLPQVFLSIFLSFVKPVSGLLDDEPSIE